MRKSIQVNYEDWKILKERCLEYDTQINTFISELLNNRFYVYKLYLNNDECYIGQSANIKQRLKTHLSSKEIIKIEILAEVSSRIKAKHIERMYILKNENCINKNFIVFDFEISEIGMYFAEILQDLYFEKYNSTMYLSSNGYINNAYVMRLTGGIQLDPHDDFIRAVAQSENIPIDKIIFTAVEKWIHPIVALDIIRLSNVETGIEIYKKLYQ